MATKKQRSRRAKTFRHDYALVKYDEEGNEIEISASELRGKSPDERETPKAAPKSAAKPARGVPQPPSWERALKRGGLIGVGVAVLFEFVGGLSPILAVLYGAAFIPMTYWSERFSYRIYTRRQAAKNQPVAASGPPGARGRKR